MNVQLYSVRWCPDCRHARRFLDEHGIKYSEIDIDADRAAESEVIRRVGKRAIPQLVIDGEWFQPYRPGRGLLIDELHQRLGISRG
ncbi:MAG: glutaredoxin family protein [Terracidiphilus sp.]|jgi:glutaredoxin